MSIISKVLVSVAVGCLRVYRVFLSPITSYFGAKCRHSPSCSNYGITAMGRFGFWRGGWMLMARLCRCHPWGSSGHDPVPKTAAPQPFWAIGAMGKWAWHTSDNDISTDTISVSEILTQKRDDFEHQQTKKQQTKKNE